MVLLMQTQYYLVMKVRGIAELSKSVLLFKKQNMIVSLSLSTETFLKTHIIVLTLVLLDQHLIEIEMWNLSTLCED